MKKLPIIFLFLITISGWATSRFSVYINDQKAGNITVERLEKGSKIITTTVETMVVKRGSSIIKTRNTYKTIETKKGGFVSLEFKALEKQLTLFPRFKITISGNKATLHLPSGNKTFNVESPKIKQDFGEQLTLKEMIKKGEKEKEYLKFDPSIMGFDHIKVRFLKKTGKGYLFAITSKETGLTEKRIVNKNGEMIFSEMNYAGIKFRIEKEEVSSLKEKKSPPQVFTPSLIKINYFFPHGEKVSSIKYKLTNKKAYNFTALKFNNQYIEKISEKECVLTVKRAYLPENPFVKKDSQYLKSNSIINLENPELAHIVRQIKKESKNTRQFIEKTVHFVFNFITDKNFDSIISPTDTIIKTRSGDCTEHSFLTVAILRKAGIPARCVVGLVSIDNIFGYHMWVEVELNGRWYPVDPTLNQVSPDPSHIRLDRFLITPQSIKTVYKTVLPLLNSLSITPQTITFQDGKKIEDPQHFFEKLFKAKTTGFDTEHSLFLLKGEEGIFEKEVYLASLFSNKKRQIEQALRMFNKWKFYTQDIKGQNTLLFLTRKKMACVFSRRSTLIIFVIKTKRPIKMENLKKYCQNKFIEVIGRCQTEF